ncbi:MAG TPA: efflux transporter outer membrane subunit [Thermoanaerobaculia bacterium]|jgi:NodT family efflux transporter outer membrane factor (OMF) lipoprotein
MKSRTSLLLIFGLLAAACTAVGPNYKKPSVETPGGFKEAPPEGWKRAQPSDAALRGKWWELFGDPALNALEEQVSVSNQTLAQAEAQFRGARAAVALARAGLFPTVTAGAQATRSHSGSSRSGSTTSSSGTTVSSSSGDATVYQVPIDFTWELDLWGRVRRDIESNVAAAQASAADVENVRLSLQAELAVDYFQLHGLDEQKRLLDSTVNEYQTALKITSNRHDQGVASGADLAEAQTQLETARAAAIDLGVSRTQLEHAIAILTGKAPADLTIAEAPIKFAPPVVPVGVPSELLERRPDIAGAERRVAAANAQIGVAQAAYYPTLSLNASGGFASSTLGKLFSLPNRFWSLGPQLLGTLFDGGRRRAVVEQAEANYDATVAGYRESVLTAFQNVEDNLAAVRILADEATQQVAATAAAERSLQLTRNRYNSGIATYLEVITAQNAAYSNERNTVDLRIRQMTASVNLIKALGGGWTTGELPGGPAVVSK